MTGVRRQTVDLQCSTDTVLSQDIVAQATSGVPLQDGVVQLQECVAGAVQFVQPGTRALRCCFHGVASVQCVRHESDYVQGEARAGSPVQASQRGESSEGW